MHYIWKSRKGEGGGGLNPSTLPHSSFTLKFCHLFITRSSRSPQKMSVIALNRFFLQGWPRWFFIFNLQPAYEHFLTILLKIHLTIMLKMSIWFIQSGHKHRCLRTEPIRTYPEIFQLEGGWRDKEGWELRWKFWKYFLFWFMFMKIYIKHNNPTNLCYNITVSPFF